MDVSASTLRDVVQRFNVRGNANSGASNNKTTHTVNTILKSITQQFERHFGVQDSQSFGDMTWLTLPNTRANKSSRLRPLAAGPGSTQQPLQASTVRKLYENFRAVLYGLIQYLPSTNWDPALKDQWSQAFEEFGTAAMELKTEGNQQTLTREPSDRQSMHWIPWPQVRDTLFRVLTQAQQLYHSDNLHRKAAKEWKQLQKAVQLALYVLIPPLRNNFARLRFVTDENAQDMARTKSPNYIFVAANGKMTLVMNQYKNDQRSTVETYDPEQDFALNTERTRRFDLAAPDAVLQKFGFSPQHLQNFLQVYRSAVQHIYGEANPDEFVFFAANGTPHSPDTMARRMGRMTKRLFGTTLQSQMMRTLFVSWFDSQRPTMPERKHIARWMLQNVETQMGT
eukprot:SAG25_NODE_772_length_5439_cov_2.322097_5_plen_396_part_00